MNVSVNAYWDNHNKGVSCTRALASDRMFVAENMERREERTEPLDGAYDLFEIN
jgi:hypothetical protein